MKWDENLSFKFVALGVALILWVSMMSRRDSTLVREFDLQLILGPRVELVSGAPEAVRVEVAGPRVALKKLNQINPIFTVNLSSAKPGHQTVRLSRDGLNLPIGTHIVNIEPAEIEIELRAAQANVGEAK